MINNIIERYSIETGRVETYEKINVEETVIVKGEEITANHEYYKRLSDNELFEPFDDPDKNLNLDYDIYRAKFGMLSPSEIKKIRKSYNLNLRDFANILGISYGNLSSIENGTIQPLYIDSLIRMASKPFSLLALIDSRKPYLDNETFKNLEKVLYDLTILESKEQQELIIDIKNNLIKFNNTVLYETNLSLEGEHKWKSSQSQSLRATFSNMFFATS